MCKKNFGVAPAKSKKRCYSPEGRERRVKERREKAQKKEIALRLLREEQILKAQKREEKIKEKRALGLL